MIDLLGTAAILVSGVALLILGLMVIRAYSPGLRAWAGRSDQYLQLAIVLGFAAQVAGAGVWMVAAPPLNGGGTWAAVAFHTTGAAAAWLHLKALHALVPPGERNAWGALDMPWYPHRRACINRALAMLTRDRP